ncbi:MAG TPA: S53 family peptidase [Solirubrobacteraceae bacterium]|nr:S53 family peptidase [Solirubrobacteraceae bacterium]
MGAAAGAGLPPGEDAEHKTQIAESLGPAQILSGYGLTGATPPSPQTIALVDAYDDATIAADLETFSSHFGLPACNEGNGCFRKVNEHGEPAPLPASSGEPEHGWAEEIATDVEVAHGVCPSCRILLVEASTNKNEDLYAAVQTAGALGANEISNSYGGEEQPTDYSAFNQPGVVITASAGDEGYLGWLTGELAEAAEYPASSPHVVAVGGTRLKLNAKTGAREGETVWNDGGKNSNSYEGHGASGGGCSANFAAAIWQRSLSDFSSVGCEGRRAVSDVSADADPYTGVAVYDSTEYKHSKGWAMIGGTSVASPIIASIFALAGGAHGVAYPAQTLYENELDDPASLHDVEVGSNGECDKHVNESNGEAKCTPEEEAHTCLEQAICLARPGYDGPSGVGTPNGLAAFRPLVEHDSEGAVTPVEAASPPPGSSEPGGGSSGATPAEPQPSKPTIVTPAISALKLTRAALAAVARRRAKLSQLGFSFRLSASVRVRVRVTLAERVRVHGRLRWRTISAPLSFIVAAGAHSRRLGGRAALAAGRYRLTLTPALGAAKSLQFRIA